MADAGLGLGRGRQFDEIDSFLAIEMFLQGWIDALICREIDAQWVDILLIFVEFEVKMRAGAASGGAYESDNLALPHRRPVVNSFREPVQMGVTTGVSRIMLDVDSLSVITIPSGESDDAVAHSANRGSPVGGEVDARMR